MDANARAPRTPSLLSAVLAFIFAGPFIAGLMGMLVLALLGGDPTAKDGGSFSLAKVVNFGMGWFRSVITEPAGWFLTVIPTVLAAIFFWALSRAKVRPRGGPNRLVAGVVGGIKGGVAATLAWVLSLGIRFQFDFVAALGSLLFVGPMVVATGVILGMLMGGWFSGRRPDSTPHADARTSDVLDQPPSARHAAHSARQNADVRSR
jgi:hypothetical protein